VVQVKESASNGATYDEIWGKIIGAYSDFAGRQLAVNAEVFKSEAETNQRTQAISPPLDKAGNSVRAQKAIADISNALGGNPYESKPR
jgi:glutaminase